MAVSFKVIIFLMKVTFVFAALLFTLESKIKFYNLLLSLLLEVIMIASLTSLKNPFKHVTVSSAKEIWFGSPAAIS